MNTSENIKQPANTPPQELSYSATRLGLRILIVDDHQMVLEGMKVMLGQTEGITVAGTASNAMEAIDFLKVNEIDIAFLDINLPDISGIELCLKIKTEFPAVKCLALSTYAERSYISRMIENGAMGYLIKSSSKEEVLEAIKRVSEGGFFMNVNLLDKTKTTKEVPFLTSREKEVLELIAEGLTNPQIGDKLFISPLTVNSHRKSLLMKFEVQNTAHLVKIASDLGLI